MKQEEVQNLIDILEKSYKAIIENDVKIIRELSNRTIHSSTIAQDYYSTSTAIILYSFSKIFERNYSEYKGWDEFLKNVKFFFKKSIQSLRKNDFEAYKEDIKEILKSINKLDKKLRTYIQEVIESSKISKASRIYEHGISMEKTAKILGVSLWELAEYAGRTGIGDVNLGVTMPIKQRIKQAEEIFRK